MEKKKRVLLVDDEAGIRKIIRLFVERDGLEVFEAPSVPEARKSIEANRPDLIVLDVLLGGQTGFELCEWIKKESDYSDIIVILFTALGQEHDREESRRVGADYYFVKPQNPKSISSKIVELLKEN